MKLNYKWGKLKTDVQDDRVLDLETIIIYYIFTG